MTELVASRSRMLPLAVRVGRSVRRALGHLGSLAWLAGECGRQALSVRPSQLGVLLQATRNQVRFTALDALPLVALTALLVGGVTLVQVLSQLSAFRPERSLSQFMALLVVRELGPVLVAILVVGRSGTAIAAEMASMKLGKEVDTLWAIGVDPVTALLLPRLAGGMVSVFTLMVLFDVIALFGGFAVATVSLPLSFHLYLHALGDAIGPAELLGTLLKAAAFGAAVPLVSAHAGLRLQASATEIPQAVTRAAVESMAAIFLLSTVISVAVYG